MPSAAITNLPRLESLYVIKNSRLNSSVTDFVCRTFILADFELFLLKSSIEMIINTQVHRNDGLASNKIAHFTVLYLMAWPLSESEAGVHLVVINDDF